MNILVVMIPLSILLLIGAGIAFFWAVNHDQFDDMDTPRLLPLLDDTPSHRAHLDDDDDTSPHRSLFDDDVSSHHSAFDDDT